MRAGRLDRRITIQRRAESFAADGEPNGAWAAIAHNWPASRNPVSGAERFTADQFVAREQVDFVVRFSPAIADLSPLDRVIYPVPTDPDEQSPDERDIYDIMAVHEVGRREGLRIMAARRAEASA